MFAQVLKGAPFGNKNAAGPHRRRTPAQDESSPEAKKLKVALYMGGFTKNLKNPAERAYAEERAHQLANGLPRPAGMSGKHGLSKQRAVQYEILINRIYKAGKARHGF